MVFSREPGCGRGTEAEMASKSPEREPGGQPRAWRPILAIVSVVTYWAAQTQIDRLLHVPVAVGWLIIALAVVLLVVERTGLPRLRRRGRDRPRVVFGPKVRRRMVQVGVALVVVVLLAGAGVLAKDRFFPAPCPIPSEVRVLSSYESLAATQEATEAFAAAMAEEDPRGCRPVNLTSYAPALSSQARHALELGWRDDQYDPVGPRPDLWLPDSSAEVRLVQSGQRTDPRLDVRGHLGSSPLVLGVPEAYHLPAGLDLSSALEQAEAAGLRLARANPNTSPAALLHSVNLFRELTDARERRGIEQRLTPSGLVGQDTRSLLCDLRRSSDEPRTAVLTSEYLLRVYNDGAPLGGDCSRRVRGGGKLRAYYSARGRGLDYPCVVMRWRDTATETEGEKQRRQWAERFCRWARAGGAADPDRVAPYQCLGLRNAAGALPPSGQCPSGPTTAGTEEGPAYQVKEIPPKELGATLRLIAQARQPGQILVAVDVSGTMRAPLRGGVTRMRAAVTGSRLLMDQLGELDQVGLWTFSSSRSDRRDTYDEQLPVGPVDATRSAAYRSRIDQRLRKLRPEAPWSPIAGTVVSGVDDLAERRATPTAGTAGKVVPRQQVLVVFTDGKQDAPGGTSAAAAYERLTSRGARANVHVFLVVLDDPGPGCGRAEMRVLAGAPGVSCLDPSFGELDDATQNVIAALLGGEPGGR